MLSYNELCCYPAAFPPLTGLTRLGFDSLLVRFRRAGACPRARSKCTRRGGQPRRRSPGAGHPHTRGVADRLLMALLWRRAYPTYAVLGFFSLHKRNARLNVLAAPETPDTPDDFPSDRPGPGRPELRSAAEVMAAFPGVRLVIGAKGQRVNKPRGEAAQRPYYSGRNKARTIKTRVAVDPRGRVEAVSEAVPGATPDLSLLSGSGVLERLGGGAAVVMDKGHAGVGNHSPGVAVVLPDRKPRGGELGDEQRAHNGRVARHRIVAEHTMARLSRFTVPRPVFRAQGRKRPGRVTRVAATLVNRRRAVTPLTTQAA